MEVSPHQAWRTTTLYLLPKTDVNVRYEPAVRSDLHFWVLHLNLQEWSRIEKAQSSFRKQSKTRVHVSMVTCCMSVFRGHLLKLLMKDENTCTQKFLVCDAPFLLLLLWLWPACLTLRVSLVIFCYYCSFIWSFCVLLLYYFSHIKTVCLKCYQ